MKYGYIISTGECDRKKQIEALKKEEILEENIYVDDSKKRSVLKSKEFLRKLLDKVEEEDVIVLKELSQLGKTNKEVKENFDIIIKKGVYLEVLEQPSLSTYKKSEKEKEMIHSLSTHLLDYFVEKEERKKELHQKKIVVEIPKPKKEKGVEIKKKVGRPRVVDTLTKEQKRLIGLYSKEKISLEECRELTNIGKDTICNLKKILFPTEKKSEKILDEAISALIQWKTGKLTTKSCMKMTGCSREFLYGLLENKKI